MKILMTTVGGLTSPDIIKSFYENEDNRKIKIIGVDPFDFAVGKFFVDEFYKVPYSGTYEIEFIDTILEILIQKNIDVIIPCGNEDVLTISKNISKFSIPVIVSEYNSLRKAFNKKEVYLGLKKLDSPLTPEFFIIRNKRELLNAIKILGYPENPVCIKSTEGRGGRGVYILKEIKDFDALFKMKPSEEIPLNAILEILPNKFSVELIVMEYLTEPLYSFYALTYKGKIIISLTHIREWGNASQTFRGRVLFDKHLEELIAPIIKYFNLSFCVNIELGTSKSGKIKLFDLNPRIAASSGIDRHIGVNFPYLALKLVLGEKFDIPNLTKIENRFIRFFDLLWER